jgi:hypothetical protein
VTPSGGLTSEVLRALSPFRATAAVAPEYFTRLEDRSEFLCLVTRWRSTEGRFTKTEAARKPAPAIMRVNCFAWRKGAGRRGVVSVSFSLKDAGDGD